MTIIKKEEPSVTLTYTPFENIKELLKQEPQNKNQKEDKKHE